MISSFLFQKLLKRSALAQGIQLMSTGEKYVEVSCGRKLLNCLQGSHKYRNSIRRRAKRSGVGANSVSRLDIASRILFPLSFTMFNIIYWAVYYFNVN